MKPLVIGVAGGSGSGKTTVARAIAEAVGGSTALLEQDAYYRPLDHLSLEDRLKVNYDHPDSMDTELLLSHLDELIARRPVEKPAYDYARYTRSAATVTVAPADVVLVEGILLFVDERLRRRLDIKVFVDVADDVRFIRRLQRDVVERGRRMESVIEQYLTAVRPMHLEFVEPSKRWADIILPEGGRNRIGIEMITARVERDVASRRAGL